MGHKLHGLFFQEIRENSCNSWRFKENYLCHSFVDFIYGIVLYIFKCDYFGLWGDKLPMSTTWVFIGLLAGREIAMRLHLENIISRYVLKMVLSDLWKVFFGLAVPVFLVFVIKILAVG